MANAARDELGVCKTCGAPDGAMHADDCLFHPKNGKRITFDEVWQEIAASRGSVLEEAARIVTGPRQAAYGHPRDNHRATAAMWTAYLNRREAASTEWGEYHTLDAVDVCVLNVLQKLSRFANTRQRDSIVDAAGFLANIEMVLDGKWDGGT